MIYNYLFYSIFLTYAIRPYGMRISLILSVIFTFIVVSKKIKNNTLVFSVYFILLFSILFITSLLSYTYYFNYIDKSFFVIYFAFIIGFTGFYLYLIDINIDSFVKSLIKFMYYLSIFAIIQQIAFLLNISIIYDLHNSIGLVGGSNISDFGFFQLYRVYSIFTEPSHFAYFISFGIFAGIKSFDKKSYFFDKIKKKYFCIILIAFLMTFSFSIFFITIVFIIFNSLKLTPKSFVIISSSIVLLFAMSRSEVISTKLEKLNTINSISNDKLGGTLFAIISNVNITFDALEDNGYLFGKGMNTHRFNYDNNIDSYISYESNLYGLNRVDASSMFLKILSDFGIAGLLFFLIMIYKFKVNNTYLSDLSVVSLFALFSYMIRTGDYGSVVFTFYLALFIIVYRNNAYAKFKRR